MATELDRGALLRSAAAGTVLQVGMVVAGHYSPAVAGLFAVLGMSISLASGAAYARWARAGTRAGAAAGGAVAGATCAAIGIAVSIALGDVPASLLALGTLSSAVTGAIGGTAAWPRSSRRAVVA